MYENDSISDVFAPGAVPAAQAYDRRNKALEPERALMLAILSDAIHCYQAGVASTSTERTRLANEAKRWLFGGRNDTRFAFEDVCGVLEIDPAYVRSGLLRWRAQRLVNERVKVLRRAPVAVDRQMGLRKSRTQKRRFAMQ